MTDLAFDTSDTTPHKLPVNDEQPAPPRTRTAPYRYAPPDLCDRGDLIAMADGARLDEDGLAVHAGKMYELVGRRDYVAAICRDYVQATLELDTADGRIAELRTELADAHRATDSANRDYTREVSRHSETASQLNRLFADSVRVTAHLTAERQARAADLQEIERLRARLIQLSTENATLAHAMAAVAAKAHAARGETTNVKWKEGL